MLLCVGVEINADYKPIAYHFVRNNTTSYWAGGSYSLPAAEVIHIFRRDFVNQVRGFPVFSAVIELLKQLDEYTTAELMAAKVSAVMSLFYERNGSANSSDLLDSGNEDDPGKFVAELAPGQASVVPEGYNVKSIASTHPNNGFDVFQICLMKKICANLGISYNKVCKDYDGISYSTLREGTLSEQAKFGEVQQFLIEQWKEIEFELFLEGLVLVGKIDKEDRRDVSLHHLFVSQKRPYFDPGKDVLATARQMKLGLTNPISELIAAGKDVEEELKSWALWKNLCAKYDVTFEAYFDQLDLVPEEADNDNNDNQNDDNNDNNNDENNNDDESLDKARD